MMHPSDYLVHFSNVLLLVAYSVRDILWLRWFAVAAALTNIPYFLVQGTVLWPPVLWALVFTAINLFQIARIYRERRPVVLSEDEQKLYDLSFRSIRPREFVSLSLVGEWKSAEAGEKVMTEGQPVSHLIIAIAGSAEVRKQATPLGSLRPGNIIGSALALTGDIPGRCHVHRARTLHALGASEPAAIHGQATGPARHPPGPRESRSGQQDWEAVVVLGLDHQTRQYLLARFWEAALGFWRRRGACRVGPDVRGHRPGAREPHPAVPVERLAPRDVRCPRQARCRRGAAPDR